MSEGNPNTTPVVVGPSEDRRGRRSGGGKKRPAPAAKKLAREHGELVKAAHRLEDAFASPCPGRERDWREEVRGALNAALETLKAHTRSAADDGGPIAEVEAVRGRPPEITEIINQHKRIARAANRLSAELGKTDSPVDCQEIRRRGLPIATLLHSHRALVADLLLDIFQVDIGGQG